MAVTAETEALLAAKFEVILPHLNERQRRLLMGAEARALGHGGIAAGYLNEQVKARQAAGLDLPRFGRHIRACGYAAA